MTCVLFKETLITVIMLNREFNKNVSKEKSFPCPLKYIDVIRSTHTDLDEAQETRIDDYWNVDGDRNLSDPFTGFTGFTLLNETPPRGYLLSEERLTKIQTTSRPDHIWSDAWTRIEKSRSKKKEIRKDNREIETRTRQRFERSLFYSSCKTKVGDIRGFAHVM